MTDSKLLALPSASSLSGGDVVYGVQGGVDVKISATQIAAFSGGGSSIGGTVTSGTSGSVLFVNPTATLAQDNTNFYVQDSPTTPQPLGSNTNFALSVNTNGDFTGTDAINIYAQMDAYLPNSLIGALTTDGATQGFSVSSSRGTGAVPVQSQTGDLIGMYGGWSAQGAVTPTYTPIAGAVIYATGSSTNNLGGEYRIYTKADGGALTQRVTVDNAGNLIVANLGAGVVQSSASGVLSSSPTALAFVDVTSTTQAMAINTTYAANNASQVVFTLPTTAAEGSICEVVGKGAGGWEIAQNSGQTIHISNVNTTTGVGGSLSSTLQYSCVMLKCIIANTDFVVTSAATNLSAV